MRIGDFAIYHGKEYSSGRIRDDIYVLRSADIGDLKEGFRECEPFYYHNTEETIVCMKDVKYEDLEEYYEIRIYADYKGFRFHVSEEANNQLSIWALMGDYRDWERLDMKLVEMGVYQKWIDKEDAEIIVEKKVILDKNNGKNTVQRKYI